MHNFLENDFKIEEVKENEENDLNVSVSDVFMEAVPLTSRNDRRHLQQSLLIQENDLVQKDRGISIFNDCQSINEG